VLSKAARYSRWDGSQWQVLGDDELRRDAQRHASYPAVAVDGSGAPIVAFREPNPTQLSIYVSRWDGTSWVPLGDTVNEPANGTSSAGIAIDASGRPLVACTEFAPGSSYTVRVRRWDGMQWVSLGGSLNGDRSRGGIFLATDLDPRGDPFVAWSISTTAFVEHWDGAPGRIWAALSTSMRSASWAQRWRRQVRLHCLPWLPGVGPEWESRAVSTYADTSLER
jgi:hypothetical protein